jgi:hypothetical protein
MFYLKSSHRVYAFAAESSSELQRWLRPLSRVLKTEPGVRERLNSMSAPLPAVLEGDADGGSGRGAERDAAARSMDDQRGSSAAPGEPSTQHSLLTWRCLKIPRRLDPKPKEREILINLRAVTLAVALPAARVIKFEYHLSRL